MRARIGWRRDSVPFTAPTRSDVRVFYDDDRDEFVVATPPPVAVEVLRLDGDGVASLIAEIEFARARRSRSRR